MFRRPCANSVIGRTCLRTRHSDGAKWSSVRPVRSAFLRSTIVYAVRSRFSHVRGNARNNFAVKTNSVYYTGPPEYATCTITAHTLTNDSNNDSACTLTLSYASFLYRTHKYATHKVLSCVRAPLLTNNNERFVSVL